MTCECCGKGPCAEGADTCQPCAENDALVVGFFSQWAPRISDAERGEHRLEDSRMRGAVCMLAYVLSSVGMACDMPIAMHDLGDDLMVWWPDDDARELWQGFASAIWRDGEGGAKVEHYAGPGVLWPLATVDAAATLDARRGQHPSEEWALAIARYAKFGREE